MRHPIAWFLALLTALVCVASPRRAATQTDTTAAQMPPSGSPVTFGNDTLFYVKAFIGPYSPARRASETTERLRRVVRQQLATFDSAVAVDNGRSTDVRLGPTTLFTVTDEDADSAHTTRSALAGERARVLTAAVRLRLPRAILRMILVGAGFTLIATVLFLLLLFGLTRILTRTIRRIRSWRGTRIQPLRVRQFEVFSSAQISDFLVRAAKFLRAVLILVLGFAYVSVVFSFFPWTRGFTSALLEWVADPLRVVAVAFVQFIPKLIFILVIAAVTRLLLKVIHLVFHGIGSGRLEVTNFPAEWADPTYKLVRLFVLVVALIVVFPYLPGSQSDAFKGVTVFLGLLLSLGSTAAVSNLVAGVVLTYMRPFRVGDRVRIADTTGDVLEKTLLVTRVRTIHNEDITIPNAMVLGEPYRQLQLDGERDRRGPPPRSHDRLRCTLAEGARAPARGGGRHRRDHQGPQAVRPADEPGRLVRELPAQCVYRPAERDAPHVRAPPREHPGRVQRRRGRDHVTALRSAAGRQPGHDPRDQSRPGRPSSSVSGGDART